MGLEQKKKSKTSMSIYPPVVPQHKEQAQLNLFANNSSVLCCRSNGLARGVSHFIFRLSPPHPPPPSLLHSFLTFTVGPASLGPPSPRPLGCRSVSACVRPHQWLWKNPCLHLTRIGCWLHLCVLLVLLEEGERGPITKHRRAARETGVMMSPPPLLFAITGCR